MATLTSVVFNPDPPLVDQNFSMIGRGVVNEEVTAGSFSAEITVFGIHVATETGDICHPDTIAFPNNYGYLYFMGIDCPLARGPMDVSIIGMISSSTPDVRHIGVKFTVKDQNSAELICIDLTMNLSG